MMKTLKKRKGVFTIEATLLIPIMLLIFMLFLDIVYLTFVKTSAKSKLELSALQSQSTMAELKNSDFNALNTSAENMNEFIDNKLKRNIFDEINAAIDTKSFDKRASIKLIPAMQNKQPWLNNINSNRNSVLSFYSFNMNYNFNFTSLLSNFYRKSNLKANNMQGDVQFKDHRIFDEIVSIDTIYSLIKDSSVTGQIADDFKKGLEKMNGE